MGWERPWQRFNNLLSFLWISLNFNSEWNHNTMHPFWRTKGLDLWGREKKRFTHFGNTNLYRDKRKEDVQSHRAKGNTCRVLQLQVSHSLWNPLYEAAGTMCIHRGGNHYTSKKPREYNYLEGACCCASLTSSVIPILMCLHSHSEQQWYSERDATWKC